jgi:hypothetical protein
MLKKLKNAVMLLVVFVILVSVGFFVVSNWGYVFSKVVVGEVLNVERVTDPQAIITSRVTREQMHLYSILLHNQSDGKMYAATSEDPQWQSIKKGFCIEARLYRYPPWRLSLANTYYNARILDPSACPAKLPSGDQVEPPADEKAPPQPAFPPGPSEPGSSAK